MAIQEFSIVGNHSASSRKTIKYTVLTIFVFISILSYGQNQHVNIGYKDNGISIGNAKNFNGLRINLIDKNVDTLNGINLALISKYQKANGLNISFHSLSKQTNGVKIAAWGSIDSICNGVTIATVIGAHKLNGLGLGFLAASADTMNGFYFTGILGTFRAQNEVEIVNGVTIGILYGIVAKEFNGLAIGLFNWTEEQKGMTIGLLNSTEELSGIQFGLWNVVENNRIFKKTPFINFNFRKKEVI